METRSFEQHMPHQANLYLSTLWRYRGALWIFREITKFVELLDEAGPGFAATAAAVATTDDGSGISEPQDPYAAAGNTTSYSTGPLFHALIREIAAKKGLSDQTSLVVDHEGILLWVLSEVKRNHKLLFPQLKVDEDGKLDQGPLYDATYTLVELLREIEPITDDAPAACIDICRETLDRVNEALRRCTAMESFLLIGYEYPEALQRARQAEGFNASKALKKLDRL